MEMINNENGKTCGRSDDIVAYIYKEIDPVERESFETHLAGCMTCTDEFAAVSDARFSVFEWHKEEFSHLPTPQFSIPYVAQTEASAGFFASVGEMIRKTGWPVTAAAGIAICIGLAFAVITLVNTGDDHVARVEVKNEPLQAASPVTVAESPQTVEPALDESNLAKPADVATISAATRVKPRAAKTAKRSQREAPAQRPKTEPLPVMGKAPVLSSYEDTEDRSLRLSDLLDEVGG